MKKGISIGIILLFIVTAVSPMVIGYNVGVFDEDIPTENYNCYNVAENIREQESFLGDPPEEEWNHTFDGPGDDKGKYVIQTTDGGYNLVD